MQQIDRAIQRGHADTEHQTNKPELLSQSISEEQKQTQFFKQGDRVQIKNIVTRVRLDKKGKIEKVFITTDNNLLLKHLARLE